LATLQEIGPGLWRWTAAHPGWRPGAAPGSPGDWPPEVGSVICHVEGATVLIDPLVPGGDEALLGALDERVAAGPGPVAVLTTIGFHRRSRDALATRYGATTSRAKRELPGGVEARPIRGFGETIFWLPSHRALVPGDRILGAVGGALRLCPESWLGYLRGDVTADRLALALRPLLELPAERVLVSHGEPVLRDGRAALAAALARFRSRPPG
jgi:hypothetical protein